MSSALITTIHRVTPENAEVTLPALLRLIHALALYEDGNYSFPRRCRC